MPIDCASVIWRSEARELRCGRFAFSTSCAVPVMSGFTLF